MTEFPRGVEAVVSPYIINDKDEILLVQQPKWNNRWGGCGGHIDPGETIAEAAKREALEEIGLEIEMVDVLRVGERICHPPEFHRDAHLLYVHIVAKVVGGQLKLDGDEIAQAKWFPIDEAIAIENTSPHCHKRLLKLKEWLGSKNA